MSKKGLNIIMKGGLIRLIVVLTIICIFSLPNLSLFFSTMNSNENFDDVNSVKISRLLSQHLYKQNMSQNELHSKNFQVESSYQRIQVLDEVNLSDTSDLSPFHKPSLKILGQDDVVIDNISPEAMEINASSMVFELNFTITGSEGAPSSTLQNLKISNAIDTFNITTWSDWTIFVGTDKYSLVFTLNRSVLSQISLGWYSFTITTQILGYSSSDSIPLAMKDLRIDVVRIEKSEFNNKLDEDQFFNITIQVREDDGIATNEIYALSGNPNTTLLSVISAGVSGTLDFVRFWKNGSIFPFGEFIFEVKLNASVAKNPAFDDAIHTLVVSVASLEGIIDNTTIDFESRGTILLVKIDEISIGTNPPFDYNLRTNNGSKHVEFRINVNDSIIVKFHLWDNRSREILNETRSIIYKDPNNPGNPFAINSSETNALGIGTINLTANIYTPIVEGYTLLFYVQGHKSSQEEEPSNVTIYWDLLDFDFIYYDKQSYGNSEEYGSLENDKILSRGVNIGDWWVLNLSVKYKSDGSPAQSAQISYRFSGDPWTNKTDGEDDDALDGIFIVNNTRFSSVTVLFECRVVNGSIFDPRGNYFVNKTFGSASFSFNIIWTYLIIEMIPREADRRLATGELTEIDLVAFWAHDSSSFTGTLDVLDDETTTRRLIVMTNGNGTWPSLRKTGVGNFNFSVIFVNDPLYDIIKFTNPTDLEPDEKYVQVAIIWDEVYFVFSDVYNSSIILSLEDSDTSCSFFANYGESRTLYCYGRHSYDGKPFVGNATLIDRDSGEEHPFVFSADGVGQWSLDQTDARREVEFKILFIESEPDYSITRVYRSKSNSAKIIWDKVHITLEATQQYSHGSWANISVSLSYEVDSAEIIDPLNFEYTLLFSNESIYENISWTSFLDYSFRPAAHWYNVTNVYDYQTGLTGFDVFYNWTDQVEGSELGNLTIYWIDDEDPDIVELQLQDLGNGTILVIVDVTDEDESWEGSGIGAVRLIDNRETVQEMFPLNGTSYVLLEEYGIYRYVFRYTFNQTIKEGGWGDYFQFAFGETLIFTVNVTDQGTPDFPGFEPPRTITSEVFFLTANSDSFIPNFIKGNRPPIDVFYITMENSNDITSITDGDVIITTFVQDDIWSGLNINSVKLNITNIATLESIVHPMTLIGDLGEGRSVSEFRWVGNLPVGEIYSLMVTVTDYAGNSNILVEEEESGDFVAPRIHNVTLQKTDNPYERLATVILEEAGLGINYVTIELTTGNITKQFNLTLQGGIGGGLSAEAQTVTYSGKLAIDFDLTDIVQPKTYSIKVIVSDKDENMMIYGKDELEDILGHEITINLDPLIFRAEVLIFGAIMLISGIIIGIRVTSKTEGYDMKRIFDESERISREEILTQMDEFALGVTVNFFDQVQGPVPVIWEPPLLEDQEQVMLDLSDKSFSTLEFVGLEETERSGTFDFSTGSYECTALGYSFSIANPQARGGKENLTIVLLLRKEWGDHLLVFQDELLEKIREIRQMIETQDSPSEVQSNARILREFVSRLMISFNKIYIRTENDSESKVE